MKRGVMLQGTSSNVGKSLLCTALCRIFFQEGFSVSPFKSQNMALNSYVTPDGGEIGRAQGAQAEAAGVVPSVHMNPILIKPKEDMAAQIIALGKPLSDMSAREYRECYLPNAEKIVRDSLVKLQKEYDVLVIEGAGSPAEVNLKDGDIVNMRTALWADVPVFLVADIDRGGVFASLLGTLDLLEPWERNLVRGIIINKFRGDIELLKSGLEFLEEKSGLPVLGVIPYLSDHGIEEEDSLSLAERSTWGNYDAPIKIAVIQLPKISNFTDLDPLLSLPDVSVKLIKEGEKIGDVDAVIIPGTKNTMADLHYLKDKGYDREIIMLAEGGAYIIGLCGGYQMLGNNLHDPEGTEGIKGSYEGLGLLKCETTFYSAKSVHQVEAGLTAERGWLSDIKGHTISGYEIHTGVTSVENNEESVMEITKRSGKDERIADGSFSYDGRVLGTHLHGFFDNREVLLAFYNALRSKKGLSCMERDSLLFKSKEESYNRIAELVRNSLDMDRVYKIMDE